MKCALRCKYQIVSTPTPKCRFRNKQDKLGKELYRATYILCRIKDCEFQELNIQPDHVHLVAIVLLKISIYTLTGHLKSRSAFRLYNRFPHIRKKLWKTFLAIGLCCRYGRRIRRYVIHQEKIEQTYEK
ncbi:transposase [Escherichia coli]|uniref:transposase n=1 Tax=Escherichia coli TaxID=562 RepID=UPI0035293084